MYCVTVENMAESRDQVAPGHAAPAVDPTIVVNAIAQLLN